MKDSGIAADVQTESVSGGMSGPEKFKAIVSKINEIINLIGILLFRLRKIVMAVPVVYAALQLASYNRENLPEQVGINLQSSGEFAQLVSRDIAVIGPLGLTAACLLLMFCSRKAMYPWAVSIFTLVLPLLILVTNLYPA